MTKAVFSIRRGKFFIAFKGCAGVESHEIFQRPSKTSMAEILSPASLKKTGGDRRPRETRAPHPRPHSGFRGWEGRTGTLHAHPYILLSHGHCHWGRGVGVGLLIKLKLSTSGLSLAPVTAWGHPLAGLLRDIFHHHRYDTLRSRHSAGGAVAVFRAVGTQGRKC